MYKFVDVKIYFLELYDLFGVFLVMFVNRVFFFSYLYLFFVYYIILVVEKKIVVVNYIFDFSLGLYVLYLNYILNIFVILYFYNLYLKYFLY